jgi:hypothetical protein
MMSTRPQTVGYSITDSPTGLAAWLHPMAHCSGLDNCFKRNQTRGFLKRS